MAMIRTSVANSEGCSWRGPSENQRWAEPCASSTPVASTASRPSEDAHVEDGADLLEPPVVEEGHRHHHHHPDDHEDGLALEVVVGVLAGQGQLPLGGRVDHDHPGHGQEHRACPPGPGRSGQTACRGRVARVAGA